MHWTYDFLHSKLRMLLPLSVLLFLLAGYPCAATAAPSGNDSRPTGIIYRREFDESSLEVLTLTDGPLLPSAFSYRTDAGFERLVLFCDRYTGSLKTDTLQLLERRFGEAQSGQDRRGEILISGTHRYVSLRDVFLRDMECVDGSGNVLEVVRGTEVYSWDQAAFSALPETSSPPVVAQAVFSSVRSADAAESAGGVRREDPVFLLFLSEAPVSGLSDLQLSSETLPALLSTLPDDAVSFVFYCIFD